MTNDFKEQVSDTTLDLVFNDYKSYTHWSVNSKVWNQVRTPISSRLTFLTSNVLGQLFTDVNYWSRYDDTE